VTAADANTDRLDESASATVAGAAGIDHTLLPAAVAGLVDVRLDPYYLTAVSEDMDADGNGGG
jgi:hypothetical protein